MFNSHNAAGVAESLEGRCLFSVSVVDNVLVIRGTSGNDAVVVDQNHNNTVDVCVNGRTTRLAAYSFHTIDADLGKGNDSIILNDLVLPFGGSVYAGAGNDSVIFNDVNINGHFIADTGDGHDSVILTDSSIEGGVIKTGDGNDSLFAYGNTFLNYGTVQMGAGNDIATLAKTSVFGYTTIDMGSGLDTFIGVRNNFPGGINVNAELKIIL